jgi:sugar lactone lactonase YvrE
MVPTVTTCLRAGVLYVPQQYDGSKLACVFVDQDSEPDGSLSDKQKYFHLHEPDTADDACPDGMRVDRAGRLWVATRIGL